MTLSIICFSCAKCTIDKMKLEAERSSCGCEGSERRWITFRVEQDEELAKWHIVVMETCYNVVCPKRLGNVSDQRRRRQLCLNITRSAEPCKCRGNSHKYSTITSTQDHTRTLQKDTMSWCHVIERIAKLLSPDRECRRRLSRQKLQRSKPLLKFIVELNDYVQAY